MTRWGDMRPIFQLITCSLIAEPLFCLTLLVLNESSFLVIDNKYKPFVIKK